MAKRHPQPRPSRNGGGFLRGLVVGLAVAAGVQLHHAGLPDWFGGGADDPVAAPNRVEPADTNFDFYRLLPKSEVRVDESDLPAETPPPAGQSAARPAVATSTEPAAPSPARAAFGVQVGSFRNRNEADRLRASLALNGFESRIVTRSTTDGTWHRVVLGPFSGRAAAEEAKAKMLASRGIDARIIPEGS